MADIVANGVTYNGVKAIAMKDTSGETVMFYEQGAAIEVSYIQSDGTQYINTGIYPNENTRVVMDVQFVGAENIPTAFGAWNAISSGAFVWCKSGSAWALMYGAKTGNAVADTSSRMTLDANKKEWKVDGSTKYTFSSQTFQTNYPLLLCAYNNAGAVGNLTALKIYSCQIYDNGTLVRNFVPKLLIGGYAVLYDTVSETYFHNSGSGAFLYGIDT